MINSVYPAPKRLEDYRPVAGAVVDELRELAAPLRGARVLHLNSTAQGGGVAEILSTLVPMLNDLGLSADWRVLRGGDDFFAVTKAMHNLLQGMNLPWTAEMRETWLHHTSVTAQSFEDEYDIVWVHDPQPAGLLQALKERSGAVRGTWVWRCHIDLSDAHQEVWDFVSRFVDCYDAVVFTMRDYIRNGFARPCVYVAPPAIDPLSAKNRDLAPDEARATLASRGIDPTRPLMLQVSRFDPWKDPLGVIDVYRLVKGEVPDVQLVMMASMASDDPEGWLYFERAARKAGDDLAIHFVNGDNSLDVNAFQRSADVVLQMSLREGFGLVVSEALWKGRPVVARGVGGIPMQVTDGQTGHLVGSVEQAAQRVIDLLRDSSLRDQLGVQGREHVRQNFLMTRYLRDHLQMMRALTNGGRCASHSTNGHTPNRDGLERPSEESQPPVLAPISCFRSASQGFFA